MKGMLILCHEIQEAFRGTRSPPDDPVAPPYFGGHMGKFREVPEFSPPARLAYIYRLRGLGWLLDGHVFVREALRRLWPKAILRELRVTERIVELPFVMRSLDLPRGSRILDVGSRWSTIPLSLSALGYEAVATDLVAFPIQGAGPHFVQADLRRPPFREASFDAATVVSTLEHIGVGHYDERLGSEDDVRVMQELHRLVRPGGILLLTVPFGRGGQGRTQRAYDGERLRRVTKDWTWEDSKFAVVHGSGWKDVTEREAADSDSVVVTRGVAMLRLRRP